MTIQMSVNAVTVTIPYVYGEPQIGPILSISKTESNRPQKRMNSALWIPIFFCRAAGD